MRILIPSEGQQKGIHMCSDDNPALVAEHSGPEAQTFATTAEFLAVIESGIGVTNDGQRHIWVSADTLIEIRGGHCVQIDRVRATLDQHGWEI